MVSPIHSGGIFDLLRGFAGKRVRYHMSKTRFQKILVFAGIMREEFMWGNCVGSSEKIWGII